MRIFYTILFIFALSESLFAQKVTDSVMLRVQYCAKYKQVTEDTSPLTDYQRLDIGTRMSKYYSYQQKRRQEFLDSVLNSNRNADNFIEVLFQESTPKKGNNYCIYKNFPEEGKTVMTDKVFRTAYWVETIDGDIEWKLQEGDTIINGYTCQKATAQFHGRTWTAWFCTELPFNDGPWKLCGLPGLILKAEESEGIFKFECIGITKPLNQAISIDNEKYEHCTLKQWQDILKEYWLDQSAFIDKELGNPPSPPPTTQGVFIPYLIEY